MLDCTKIDALMMDWLYKELDESTTATFNTHVAECAHCEGELAALQRTRAAVKDWPQVEPPLAVSNILLHEAAKRAPAASNPSVTASGYLALRLELFLRRREPRARSGVSAWRRLGFPSTTRRRPRRARGARSLQTPNTGRFDGSSGSTDRRSQRCRSSTGSGICFPRSSRP